jgi:nitrogen fixation protein FixH
MTSIDLNPPVPAKRGGKIDRKPLSGWTVLAILLAFFGTVATVNGIMIHYALSTFPGVTDDNAYEHGVHYNDTLAAAALQNKVGWVAQGRIVRGLEGRAAVEISIRDKDGAPVEGLQVAGRLEFMPDSHFDMALDLTETSAGVYRTEIKANSGVWLLEMSASRQEEVLYRSRNRLSLR